MTTPPQADSLDATVNYQRVEPSVDGDSSSSARGPVALVEGTSPDFAAETALLLRGRLKAIALIHAIAFGAAFAGNLFVAGAPLTGLRAAILAVIFGNFLLLRSKLSLSLRMLRIVDLAVLSAISLQLSLMQVARVSRYAVFGDAASAASARQLFFCAWSLVIMTYGVFVPNTWRRAAILLLPLGCLPYLLMYVLQHSSAAVASALAADHARSPIPLPLIAALIAVFAAQSSHGIRWAAFRAKRFGQYVLKEQIGRGGMGEVFRAEHQILRRPCAIKLIRPDREADMVELERFEREVRTTARLSHWNTVEIYDYGRTDDGTLYYVMELLRGMSLEELVRRHGPLSPARAVHFLRQATAALIEAHKIGLVHRDIKPANIFAAERGGVYDVAKLLDFGLVHDRGSNGQASTSDRGFSGSPLYMPPEQAKSGEVDARSDLYALGAVAYELLTGCPPFQGRSLFELIDAHATRNVVPPSELQPDIPADVEQVVLRCLAKSPFDRYQSAAELRDALSACSCSAEWTDTRAASWWNDVAAPSGISVF
jgi:eukaryotic-like serine/threonine-protein kinase